MKLIYKESISSDVWNWQETLNNTGSYGQDWLKNWPKDLTKKDAHDKKKMRAYLNNKYYKSGAVKKYIEWMQVAINPKNIEEPLIKITGKKVPFKEVYVIFTTNMRCPYDSDDGGFYAHYGASPDWFYKTAMHECMHLIVHKYYWKMMLDAGLSNQQAHDIKEALTVLLNPEFEKWSIPSKGYPNHQNLRKDIEKIAKSEKDFGKILSKTIKVFLKKYRKKVS